MATRQRRLKSGRTATEAAGVALIFATLSCSTRPAVHQTSAEQEPSPAPRQASPEKAQRSSPKLPAPTDFRPFALVELFTSEGCSSCPPADRLLTHIVEAYHGQPVHALSFHVDYWNDLGYADPFSDERYSDRQRMYARRADDHQVFTPQMIVNGTHSFVGSHGNVAGPVVDEALTTSAKVAIELRAQSLTEEGRVRRVSEPEVAQRVRVWYRVAPPRRSGVLNVAVVSKHAKSEVAAGENAGRTLTHRNVVRGFARVSLDSGSSGRVDVAVQPGFRPPDALAVAYLQRPNGIRILGARAVPLVDPSASEP
jgi:hypothetical protein